MKIIIGFLAILPITESALKDCEACIYGKCYSKELLLDSPNYLSLVRIHAVDFTNKIFYCEFLSDNFKTFFGAMTEDKTVKSLHRTASCSVTVDQNSQDVYVTSQRGNFKFNPNSSGTENTFTLFNNLDYLQFHEGKLYFAQRNRLYSLMNHTFESVFYNYNYNIKEFIIDKHSDIYFRSGFDNAIYKINKNNPVSFLFSREDYQMTIDKNGQAIFSTNDKLFTVNSTTNQLIHIGDFEYIRDFKPVFDWDNNIVYADLDKLYVLKATHRSCAVKDGVISKVCNQYCEPSRRCIFICD